MPPSPPQFTRNAVRNRFQRVAREITKREMVYADFIMTASKLLLQACE